MGIVSAHDEIHDLSPIADVEQFTSVVVRAR